MKTAAMATESGYYKNIELTAGLQARRVRRLKNYTRSQAEAGWRAMPATKKYHLIHNQCFLNTVAMQEDL